MSVIYFPNRVYHGNDKVPSIDRVMAKRQVRTAQGAANLAAVNLDAELTCNTQWQIDSIMFYFNNVASKDYSAHIANGVKIIANLNDYLWIVSSLVPAQRVIMDPGFYTGTELATHLQTKLNAMPAFSTHVPTLTFTVAYNAATGIFTITPSTGTLKYLSIDITQPLSIRDSIAGHLFGLTTTSAFGATITSDTAVLGLDSEFTIISQTSSAATSYVHTGLEVLTMDQSLHLLANSGSSVSTNYMVTYEEIV